MERAVLFVCLGNICRSPAAEAILRERLLAAGAAGKVRVESAGTAGYHTGKEADGRMRHAAQRRGYAITSRARQLEPRDLQVYDRIIAMDRSNYADIQRYAEGSAAHVKMLSEYLDRGDGWPRDVPDPYYGDGEGFEYVLDMLEAAMPKILAELDQLD